jgi:hypothetical protein
MIQQLDKLCWATAHVARPFFVKDRGWAKRVFAYISEQDMPGGVISEKGRVLGRGQTNARTGPCFHDCLDML